MTAERSAVNRAVMITEPRHACRFRWTGAGDNAAQLERCSHPDCDEERYRFLPYAQYGHKPEFFSEWRGTYHED
jgi:hypothetical protein